jgi:hypothetical protein
MSRPPGPWRPPRARYLPGGQGVEQNLPRSRDRESCIQAFKSTPARARGDSACYGSPRRWPRRRRTRRSHTLPPRSGDGHNDSDRNRNGDGREERVSFRCRQTQDCVTGRIIRRRLRIHC